MYATATAILAELGLPEGPRSAYIGRLIGQASARIDSYCGGSLARMTAVETVVVPRSTRLVQTLRVRRRPLLSVASIVNADSGAEIAPTDYSIGDAAAGAIYASRGWGPGCLSVGLGLFGFGDISAGAVRYSVTYDAGYDAPGTIGSPASPVPADLEGACIELVKAWYRQGERDPMVRAEEVEGVGRTEFWVGNIPSAGGSGLPDSVTGVLDRYAAIDL